MYNLKRDFRKTKTDKILKDVKQTLTDDQKFLRETFFYVLIPKLITSERECKKCLDVMGDLLQLRHNLDKKAQKDVDDYLKTLGYYINEFESKRYSIDDITPNEYLLYLLENRDVKRKELIGPVFNTASALSRACNGSRKITVEQAKKLGKFFKVDFKNFL